MRFLSLIATVLISLPLSAFALSFALSNRGDGIAVRLWPLTGDYAVTAGTLGVVMLGIGFAAGAVFVSLIYQPLRYRLWQQERRVLRLEADLKAAEEKLTPVTEVSPVASPLPTVPGARALTTQSALRDVEAGALRF